MGTVFEPKHDSLDGIFAGGMTYQIPEYQRPYAWDCKGKTDRDSQINQLWDDLWDFFESQGSDNKKEYFLGSMVVINQGHRTRSVVDGQQRLTSLVLLFTAMRCFLEQRIARRKNGAETLAQDIEAWATDAIRTLHDMTHDRQGLGLVRKAKVRIQRTSGQDFDDVLQLATECRHKDALPKMDERYRDIAYRYFDNRDFFLGKLNEVFLASGTFGVDESSAFNRFSIFLLQRVALVVITTTDFDTAFSIFEILNNRGLPLGNVDLLRNFIISKFAEVKGEDSSAKWQHLEDEYGIADDFISRWVESLHGVKQVKSAFNAVRQRFDDMPDPLSPKHKIEVLYAELERDLGLYRTIINPIEEIEHKPLCKALQLIGVFGNRRYSTNFLLSLFRHYDYRGQPEPAQDMLELTTDYERFAIWSLLMPGVRFASKPVFEAMRELNAGRPAKAAEYLTRDIDRTTLARQLDGAINSNATAGVVLAALVWTMDDDDSDVVTQQFHMSRASVEHILPQKPEKGTNWLTDFSQSFRDEYTYRLGNMTLLTGRKNSQARNYGFARKQAVYKKTKLAMTQELTRISSITEAFIKERHERMVAALCDRWSLT